MPADAAKLRAISNEADELIARGEWTREHFERLWAEAEKAAGGNGDLAEFMVRLAEPEWIALDPAK